jgi:agmatinase
MSHRRGSARGPERRRTGRAGPAGRTVLTVRGGIRGPLYADADLTQDTELGFQVLSAPDVEQLGVTGMVERIRQQVGNRPVYVSIDIDVFDPAHAPGTGTPEADGLSSRELLATLRSFARLNLIGTDIVEVAPAYDHVQITGIAAAHAGYELLSALAARKAAPQAPAPRESKDRPGPDLRRLPDARSPALPRSSMVRG